MATVIASCKPRKRKPSRVIVEFESDREGIEVGAEIAMKRGLAKGRALDEEEIAALLAEDEGLRCRERAWNLLSHRPRTRAELRRALRQRKFSKQVVEETVAHIADTGYLDDAAYARQYVEQAVQAGREGPRMAAQKLAQRGVARETVEAALNPLADRGTQESAAVALLEKWNRRSKPEDPGKRRQAAAAYLARRGFDADLVWECVRRVIGSPEDL